MVNIAQYIKDERKRQGITTTAFAEKMPFSRQRTEELLKDEDFQLYHARIMLNALGKDIDIQKKDGSPVEFDKEEFFAKAKEGRIYYHREEEVIDSMGLKFVIINTDADSAQKNNK